MRQKDHFSIPYKERVFLTDGLRIPLAMLLGMLLTCLVLVMPSPDDKFKVIAYYVLTTVFMYWLLGFSYGVKIRISKQLMWDGSRRNTLRLDGVNKEGTRTILFTDINELELIEYEIPFWRTFLGLEGADEHPEAYRLRQPGYRGKGLMVTYTATGMFDNVASEIQVLFPSRHAVALQALLLAEISRQKLGLNN